MLAASRMPFAAEVAGRFARDALGSGAGEVCAVFHRSFYLQFSGKRYACVGDASIGRGPLNALVDDFRMPALGEKLRVATGNCRLWQPPVPARKLAVDLRALQEAAVRLIPEDGLGGLIVGSHNALPNHAQASLQALDAWLAGN